MEPVTITLVGLGLFALFGKKKATPASAAKTAAEVDALSDKVEALTFDQQLSAGIVAQGAAAADKIYQALADQITAMGFKIGSVGRPADADGRSVSMYVANNAAVTDVPEKDFNASSVSSKWENLSRVSFNAKKDGAFDPGEAASFVSESNGLAAALFELAKVQEKCRAIKAQMQSVHKQYFDAYIQAGKDAKIYDAGAQGLQVDPTAGITIDQALLTELTQKWTAFAGYLGNKNPTPEGLNSAISELGASWSKVVNSYKVQSASFGSNFDAAKAVLTRLLNAGTQGRFKSGDYLMRLFQAVQSGNFKFDGSYENIAPTDAGGVETAGWSYIGHIDQDLKQMGL